MGIRSLPFLKGKKGWQFAGGGLSADGGGNVPIATDSTVGIVQPDGSTITVDSNGVISSHGFTVANNAGAHNAIYCGKSLGMSVSEAQYASIQAGTFEGMFIGDYWTIDNVTYRIAAFDYWFNTGDTACTVHHVVIVPDENFTAQKMNTEGVTTGGYVGSEMYTTNINDVKTAINTAFGSLHILSHREYLINAVSNGRPSSGDWYNSTIDLMNEQMVYGGFMFESANDGNTLPTKQTIDKTQLPLFAFNPSKICNGDAWWLRSIASSSKFAGVNAYGLASYHHASNAYGIRPAFAIYQPTI